jgi:predicted nucleic acid-binding protein
MRFVDTNVLLYAISAAPSEADKADRARTLLRQRDLALSVQVLQEFYAQATRPTAPTRLGHDEATAFLGPLRRYPIQPGTLELFEAALAIRARRQISYWDAAIVAAAKLLGCDELLTEDLQDGLDIDGVLVVDPFR